MIATLKQYSKHKDGTYVSLLLNLESKKALDRFTSEQLNLKDDNKVDPATYHCTLIYSRTPVPDAETLEIPKLVYAHVIGYEVFDTKQGNKCLVLRLNCPTAHEINGVLNKMGATSDYNEYKPHITICYDYKGELDLSRLPIPAFDIIFDDHEVKPLDEDYVPPTAK